MDSSISETNENPIPVRVATFSISDDLRAMSIVWRRELIRFFRNRTRMMTSLVQPILFLFVLGTGLSPIVPKANGNSVDFRTFMFPGVISMAVLFVSIFSAVSIVWDREFGFLREMLVAPVRRSALLIGKCAGGASVATFQGAMLLLLAGAVHVPYSPVLFVTLLAEIALLALALTAFGMMIAARMGQVESFQVVMQLCVFPMFFLSGAVFPLSHLPAWLKMLTRLDPLSYAVDPMRRAVFEHVSAPFALRHVLNPGVTWAGWRLPTLFELGIVGLMGALMLMIAVLEFSRPE